MLFRGEKGGNPDIVRQSEQRRARDVSIVDQVIELDEKWRVCQFEQEQTKKEQNALAKQISQMKKADPKADIKELTQKSTEIKSRMPLLEEKAQDLLNKRNSILHRVGNIVHDSVVVSNTEDDNLILRVWGAVDPSKVCDGSPGRFAHHELLAKIGGVDYKRGAEVAGHRAFYLKGFGAMLNSALLQYGQSFLRKKGYTNVQPPFFMKREWMEKTAELKDFHESLYRIPDLPTDASTDKNNTKSDREDLFLIATSEQPLCALHAEEVIEPKDLPIKYAGVSTCFRKEAGSHGKDMRGIFRVHQFEKVEQLILCHPDDSWKLHEEMIQISEEFYQSLNIPYQVVSIVSGALNDAAAKKYDLEAWFPSYGAYKELVSCSNCTDYQSRDVNIRLGTTKSVTGEKNRVFVHMLNGTLTATERTLCCLLENYQTEHGISVPAQLQPYMDGISFIPFCA